MDKTCPPPPKKILCDLQNLDKSLDEEEFYTYLVTPSPKDSYENQLIHKLLKPLLVQICASNRASSKCRLTIPVGSEFYP